TGGGGALAVPFRQPAELGRQDDRLQGVEPGVPAHDPVLVLRFATVVAEQAHPGGEDLVIGEDGAAVAVAPEVLPRVEAGGRGPAPGPRPRVEPGGALALGG